MESWSRCGTCMEVFDKEGVAVKKNRSEGFVMAEVLVTVLFVTVFTSLLFSSGARRYRSALNFAAGTEARLAARRWCRSLWRICARRSRQESLKNYRDRRDFRRRRRPVWAETGNGEKKRIETVISSYWKEDGSGLVLQAVCTVNDRKEGASRLIPMAPVFVSTPSSAERSGEEKP